MPIEVTLSERDVNNVYLNLIIKKRDSTNEASILCFGGANEPGKL